MASVETMLGRQHALADFGEFALNSDKLQEILSEACRLVAEALETDYAKIIQIENDRDELLVKAGVGWPDGVVGGERVSLGERFSESYAILQRRPVITNNIAE